MEPPGGLLRFFLRVPIGLYRLRLGWLLGGRFVQIEHRGRRTGKRRRNVLEVVGRGQSPDTFYVAAAWGDRADWFRNIEIEPRIRATVGRRRFKAKATVLVPDAGHEVLRRYREEHGLAARMLARVMGKQSFDEVIETTPIVEISPRV